MLQCARRCRTAAHHSGPAALSLPPLVDLAVPCRLHFAEHDIRVGIRLKRVDTRLCDRPAADLRCPPDRRPRRPFSSSTAARVVVTRQAAVIDAELPRGLKVIHADVVPRGAPAHPGKPWSRHHAESPKQSEAATPPGAVPQPCRSSLPWWWIEDRLIGNPGPCSLRHRVVHPQDQLLSPEGTVGALHPSV